MHCAAAKKMQEVDESMRVDMRAGCCVAFEGAGEERRGLEPVS